MSKVLEIAQSLGHKIDRTHCPPSGHLDTWVKLTRTPAKHDDLGNVVKLPTAVCSRHNLAIILENDPKYESLQYCVQSDRVLYNGAMIEPCDIEQIALDLERDYRLKTKDTFLVGCIIRVANQNRVEPIREWLESLPPWDAQTDVPRIAGMFGERWGVEIPHGTKPFYDMLAVRFMVSLVARIMRPGCDVHTVLTLVGAKGLGKSRVLRALAGQTWFSDSNINITNKSAYELIHQSLVWVWELAEMHALHGRSANNAKMFLTSPADRYRPTWGKTPVLRRRRTVFVATTNDMQFLTDGPERRFWPLQIVRPVDVDWVANNRVDLFREALHHYHNNVQWHLTPTEAAELERIQHAYIVADPWAVTAQHVLQAANGPNANPDRPATTDTILDALDVPMAQRHVGHNRRISQVCRDLGYRIKQTKTGRVWVQND